MTKRRFLALIWCAVLLGFSGASNAWAVDYLAGDKLRETIKNITLDFVLPDKTVEQWVHKESGLVSEIITDFAAKKRTVIFVGDWSIEDETLVCMKDRRPNRDKVCYKYAIQDGILKQYTASGVLTLRPMMVEEK